MFLAFAVLTVEIFLVFTHVSFVKFLRVHAAVNARRGEKMQDIDKLVLDVIVVHGLRVFPPFEVDFRKEFRKFGYDCKHFFLYPLFL